MRPSIYGDEQTDVCRCNHLAGEHHAGHCMALGCWCLSFQASTAARGVRNDRRRALDHDHPDGPLLSQPTSRLSACSCGKKLVRYLNGRGDELLVCPRCDAHPRR